MVVLYYLKIFLLYCSRTTEISSCVAVVLPEIFLFMPPEIFTCVTAVPPEISFYIVFVSPEISFCMLQLYYLKFSIISIISLIYY